MTTSMTIIMFLIGTLLSVVGFLVSFLLVRIFKALDSVDTRHREMSEILLERHAEFRVSLASLPCRNGVACDFIRERSDL